MLQEYLLYHRSSITVYCLRGLSSMPNMGHTETPPYLKPQTRKVSYKNDLFY